MAAPLPVTESVAPLTPVAPLPDVSLWNILALLIALAAAGGSLWLSLGMGLQACPLCYYQRSFVMAAAAVLLMAQLTEFRSSTAVSLLAMPLAMAGLGVAAFHVSRELAGKMECPPGLLGLGTAPQQSLAVHLLLVLVLAVAARRRPVVVPGMLLGGLLAFACVQSAAAPPKPSPADYEQPPVICRPVQA